MAQEKKDSKLFYFDKEAAKHILEGAEIMYNAVSTTYGPKGRNVLIEKVYGRPVLTRDGVTVARETYSSVREVNTPMQLLLEASSTTNRVAGDGTTATVVLTYNLINQAFQRVAAGVNPMQVKQEILEDSYKILAELESLSQPVQKGQLEQVATVSSGDPLLGKLISEAVEHVGSDGGIITEKAPISGIDREYVDGYYMQQGFPAIETGKKTVENCYVVVTAKPLTSAVDGLEIITKIGMLAHEEQQIPVNQPLTQPLRIAFFGEIEGDAYRVIVDNIVKGAFDGVVVKTPPMGDMGVQYLEDLAVYTGGQTITAGQTLGSVDGSYIGRAGKITCTVSDTVIFDGQHADEDLNVRVSELKERLAVEEIDAIAEKLRDRISKLESKIARFRIGGATDTEKEELEFRIEDSIQASRAAASKGVVPGGGVTLVRLSKNEDISSLFRDAMRGCFLKLMENAGLMSQVKLNAALEAKDNYGFNLRGDEDELVDMVKAGVLDPTLVISEVVTNAASNAAAAVTVGAIITFVDREEK